MEDYLRHNFEIPYNPRSEDDCYNRTLLDFIDIERFDSTGQKIQSNIVNVFMRHPP